MCPSGQFSVLSLGHSSTPSENCSAFFTLRKIFLCVFVALAFFSATTQSVFADLIVQVGNAQVTREDRDMLMFFLKSLEELHKLMPWRLHAKSLDLSVQPRMYFLLNLANQMQFFPVHPKTNHIPTIFTRQHCRSQR